jgi:hypothetical protein
MGFKEFFRNISSIYGFYSLKRKTEIKYCCSKRGKGASGRQGVGFEVEKNHNNLYFITQRFDQGS